MKPTCLFFALLVLIVSSSVVAWKLSAPKQVALRSAALIASIGLFSDNANAALTAAPWDNKVQYEVLQSGSGSAPKVSDLVDIRFKGSFNGLKFDDTFKTEQPYTYRAGVGLLLPGIDNAVVHMKVGDKYHLVFSGDNSFINGRPSAPGIPRIPPGGELDYEVLLENMPGTEEEIILGDL